MLNKTLRGIEIMGKYKHSKNSIRNQAKYILQSQTRFGCSKHEAKDIEKHRFGDAMSGIHSYNTFFTYSKEVDLFIRYAEKELESIGCTKYVRLSGLKDMAEDYLRQQEKRGLSVYTLGLKRAALCRIFRNLEYKPPSRSNAEITRSRGEAARDRRFSESRNADLITICKNTGGRRHDIEKLTRDSFFEKEGRLFVKFERSKGGRTRETPVLNDDRVREILDRRTENNDDRLFDRIHSAADIHAYRREYAKELYREVMENQEFREELQKFYRLQEINREYISRDGDREHYDKDAMAIVSKALGHNRIDTTIKNYVK